MGVRARRPGIALSVVAVLVFGGITTISTASAQAGCDPIQTTPVYDPAIPTGEDVFSPPFEIGTQEVTSDQANDYMTSSLTRRSIHPQPRLGRSVALWARRSCAA